MEKMKVFIPCYGRCEFNNLSEAVSYVKQRPGGLPIYIDDIVFYNIRFRDCLREKGLDGVVTMLRDEAPAIALEKEAVDRLKEKWSHRMDEHIADYDIQCLPKKQWFKIKDCWFEGLDDVDDQSEIYGNPRHTYSKWTTREGYKRNPAGLHIGNIWESYPKFDSSDDADGRCYENYVFSMQPLTEAMMERYCKEVSANFNACMVHEYIPQDLLPILYYNGDSDYILLASAKNSGLDILKV